MLSKVQLALIIFGVLVAVCHSAPAKLDDLRPEPRYVDDDDDDDDDDDKRPYSFAWEASRHYHGAPDREHREQRGDDGITRGVYRYVDPTLKVQEVVYTADADGFHVENTNLPEYTAAQNAARERHSQLFQQIAEEHSKIGSQHALVAAERGHEYVPYVEPPPRPVTYSASASVAAPLPEFTPIVERARSRHQELFDRIAAQHARIAAERKTDPSLEETGEPYQ